MTLENPLLSPSFEIPFDRIRAEHVEPAVEAHLKTAQARIDAIKTHSGERTYANTLFALDEAGLELEIVMSVVGHLESVVTGPELRAAYNAVQPAVSTFYTGIPLDAQLWLAIKEFAATDEAKNLKGAQARLLKKTVDEFRRHGADLDAEGKKKLEALSVELAMITTKFGQNVVDSSAAFELYVDDEADLEGLPARAKESARRSAESKGKSGFRLTLDGPTYIAAMTYLDNADLRRALWQAYATRATSGAHDNRALITRILELRRERAKLLGFDSFADLVLADRMAKNGATAQGFVTRLHEKTVSAFAREQVELLEFRKSLEGASAPALSPWDVTYYAEKQRRALYDWDDEELRPYLPVERAISGVFAIAKRLYGVEVVRNEEAAIWHPLVSAYHLNDADGSLLGNFYMDLFPRETKRDGAWMGTFISGRAAEPHLATVCGNFTPSQGDTPALLTHREVETLFHEFGHLLHQLLSRVEVRSLAGARVAWDFVELPSQIMENWCWEKEGLALIAAHYQTGEPVPDAMFQKMYRAKNFRAASDQMRQLGFASVDLAMHIDYDPACDGDVMAYARKVLAGYAPAKFPDDYAMIASFGHLFADSVGYAAGYYSYKWAEALDADAFTRFQKEGVFNRTTGQAFRDAVLSRGDSDDPLTLYRNFMGRDPDPDALLVRSGLQ
ncbi:MAG: M3 family metallopeptidase [Sandaracinaceae bacterium]|nr:M3 family metallopeptidase [Sandaracinaceae bacterium]